MKQQRLGLRIEGLWEALHWPLMVALLAAAVIWSGVLTAWTQPWPLFVGLCLAALFGFSLKPLFRLRALPATTVLRHLETANGLEHREASSIADQIAPESGGDDIWVEHRKRSLAALTHIKVRPPQSAWRLFDARALRLPLVMAAVTAWFLGVGDATSSLQTVLNFSPPPAAAKPVVLDAWLKPPAYTGKQPMLLTSPAMVAKLREQPDLTVPENSVLNLRVTGSAKPSVEFFSPSAPDQKVSPASAKIENNAQGLTADVKLDRPLIARVMDGATEIASYRINLVADDAPKIEFVGEPKADDNNKLSVGWHVSDDYGVKSVSAEISLADKQETADGFASNGVFLYPAPEFKVVLQKPNAKDEKGESKADVTGHAWAGLYAEMVLTAVDGAGHKVSTQPKRFKLPERDFIKPLARALQEQRKKFILAPQDAADASTMIGTMMIYPTDIKGNSGLILNLDSVNSKLSRASAPDDVATVTKDIWPLIIQVEEGKLGNVRDRLKELAQQLQQALREGAPQSKIDELNRKMREAMKDLMKELQKEGKNRSAQGQKQQRGGKSITQQQLQDMLDKLDQLQKEGKTAEAQELLNQLDQMLQNLQPGTQQADGEGDEGQDQMDGLSDLMGKQRKLMDETQRMGKDGKQGQGLGDKQRDLKDQLGKLGRGSKEPGGDNKGSGEGDQPGDLDGALGDADKNMGNAEGGLREGDRGRALKEQNQALRNMLKGMNDLAQKMQKNGDGKQGRNGRGGDDTDPLGRPLAHHPRSVGENQNIVPKDLAQRRAREILEQLRSRANEEGLDDETKAYIDKLLKGQF